MSSLYEANPFFRVGFPLTRNPLPQSSSWWLHKGQRWCLDRRRIAGMSNQLGGYFLMPPPPICDFRDSEIPEFPKFESSPHRFRWGNGCHFPLFHRCEYPEKIMMLGRRSGFLLGRPAYFQGNHHCCRTEATKANHSRLPSQSPKPRWNLHPPTNNQHLKSLQHFGKKKNSRSWQKLPEMCKESI